MRLLSACAAAAAVASSGVLCATSVPSNEARKVESSGSTRETDSASLASLSSFPTSVAGAEAVAGSSASSVGSCTGGLPSGMKYGKNVLEFQFADQPKRQHIVYLPKSYDGIEPLPTVLGLHYSNGNIHSIDAMANLTALSERHHFVWMAAQGGVTFKNKQGYAWNVPFVPTTDDSKIEGAVLEDRTYLTALVQHVQSSLCLNVAQSYAMGHSGGGRMASSLVCNPKTSQHFAGIVTSSSIRAGPSAGPDYTAPLAKGQANACNPSHPIGIVALHGFSDQTNPYAGTPKDATTDDKKRWGYSVQSALHQWALLNTCDLSSNSTFDATKSTPVIHQQTIQCPSGNITAWLQEDWPHQYFSTTRPDFSPGDHWWAAVSRYSHTPAPVMTREVPRVGDDA